MKKIETLKTVAGIAVSIGVSAIVGGAIKTMNPTEAAGLVKKVCIGLGALVLSSMASEKAVIYTEDKIDKAVIGTKKVLKEAGELG